MPGPCGEKCEDCYWGECIPGILKQDQISDLRCHNTVVIKSLKVEYMYKDWWCEHFEDREERKRGIESIREISRRLEELRDQRQVDLLDDLGIGKGKVN